jgi:hypothetical protein
MLPTKFRFIWIKGFREDGFNKSNNQKKRIANGGLKRTTDAKKLSHKCDVLNSIIAMETEDENIIQVCFLCKF